MMSALTKVGVPRLLREFVQDEVSVPGLLRDSVLAEVGVPGPRMKFAPA